jgi:hypothetical protein
VAWFTKLDNQLSSKDAHEYFKLQRCEELHYELRAHFNVTFAPIAPSIITLLKVVKTTKVEKNINNISGIIAIYIGM